MAKPSQLQQQGVERAVHDTPEKQSNNPIPKGSQHAGCGGVPPSIGLPQLLH